MGEVCIGVSNTKFIENRENIGVKKERGRIGGRIMIRHESFDWNEILNGYTWLYKSFKK